MTWEGPKINIFKIGKSCRQSGISNLSPMMVLTNLSYVCLQSSDGIWNVRKNMADNDIYRVIDLVGVCFFSVSTTFFYLFNYLSHNYLITSHTTI